MLWIAKQQKQLKTKNMRQNYWFCQRHLAIKLISWNQELATASYDGFLYGYNFVKTNTQGKETHWLLENIRRDVWKCLPYSRKVPADNYTRPANISVEKHS